MRRIEKLMQGVHFTGSDGVRREISLPHTWNGKDGQDGGNDYYRGKCVYDCMVNKPDYAEDERVYLQFHGVNASADIKLNHQTLYHHDGGYSTFRVDVTEYLQEENQLEVEVDNSVNRFVYPQKADFTFYGGIYRDVEFLIVNKAHFDLDYYGGFGMKYEAELLTEAVEVKNGDSSQRMADAGLVVTTYLNDVARQIGAEVQVKLLDGDGKKTAWGTAAAFEDALGEKVMVTHLSIEKAQLWDGLENPYLYTLVAELTKDGTMLDSIYCNCGIRSFHFSAKEGFFLNGRSYPLHGVSRHQDFKEIGNAIDREKMDYDMELIREVGANTIRLAHYQHDQYFYDLCDKYGMIVWAEIPYISEHMPNGRENTLSQMKELIVQNHHHPSVVTWGISNEITISGRKHKKDMLENHRILQKLCKEMDPKRPTTLACFAMCHPFHPVTKITDLIGWNLYLGWYVPGLFLNDWWISFYHKIYPERCLCYSEYGAEGMSNLHSSRPRRGDNTEEYQCKYHEFMLKCFRRHPYLWATYVWNMFDFAADARNQGGEPGMNHKGLVTFDRRIKKDSFYLYKAYWTKEPFVHLAGKRYEYRTGDMTEITVYSNQKEMTLYQNGKPVDTKCGECVFRFRLAMQEENHIEVSAGACTDSAVFYKTDKEREDYKLKKGSSANWM